MALLDALLFLWLLFMVHLCKEYNLKYTINTVPRRAYHRMPQKIVPSITLSESKLLSCIVGLHIYGPLGDCADFVADNYFFLPNTGVWRCITSGTT